MKGLFWKRTLAGCLALMIVSGSVPVQPIADIVANMAITVSAETDDDDYLDTTEISFDPVGKIKGDASYGDFSDDTLPIGKVIRKGTVLKAIGKLNSDPDEGEEQDYVGQTICYLHINGQEYASWFEANGIPETWGTWKADDDYKITNFSKQYDDSCGDQTVYYISIELNNPPEEEDLLSLSVLNCQQGDNTLSLYEGAAKLFDGDKDSKWCSVDWSYSSYELKDCDWVTFTTGQACILNSYTLTTGGDTDVNPGRNWKSWRIYGSNNAAAKEYELEHNTDNTADVDTNLWSLIDQVKDDKTLQGASTTDYTYNVENSFAYKYYLLVIDEVKEELKGEGQDTNITVHQMAEMTLGLESPLKIADNIKNGTVTAKARTTGQNADIDVTLTIEPAEGYILDSLSVTDDDGNDIEVTDNVFTISGGHAYVTANFIKDPITYVDADGKSVSTSDYNFVTSETTRLKGTMIVPAGETVDLGNRCVNVSNGAKLILSDGAELKIGSESYDYLCLSGSSSTLSIYGQSEQTGKLTLECDSNAVVVGDLNIYGGDISVSGNNGLDCNYNVKIAGGKVTATGKNAAIRGGDSLTITGGEIKATSDEQAALVSFDDVTITGGKVEAQGGIAGIKSSSGSIYLGWTNADDSIKANSYKADEGSVILSKSFVINDGVTIAAADNISGETLTPCGYKATFVDVNDENGETFVYKNFGASIETNKVIKPDEPTRDGCIFMGWYLEGSDKPFDFDTPLTEDITLYARRVSNKIPYIDENGEEVILEPEDYTLITSSTTEWSGVMVAARDVKINEQVKLTGDTKLILCDGAEIKSEYKSDRYDAIEGSTNSSLEIYGQSAGTGTLTTDKGYRGISVFGNTVINGGTVNSQAEFAGFYVLGDLIINGGTVNAVSEYNGLHASQDVIINGGTVNANAETHGISGFENVIINGGIVNVQGNYDGIRGKDVFINGGKVTTDVIIGENSITLSQLDPEDFVYADSYTARDGEITVADGKVYKDNDGNLYTGKLDEGSINGKTLSPFVYSVKFRSGKTVISEVYVPHTDSAKVAQPEDPIKDGYTFDGWYEYGEDTPFDFSTPITGDTTLYAQFTKKPLVLEKVAAKPATCTEEGNIEYYIGSDEKLYVRVGGTYIETTLEDVTIPMTAHTYGAPEWTWDGYTAASAAFTCDVCGDVQTADAVITSETTEPTNDENGSIVYTATVTFDGKEYTDTKTEILYKLVKTDISTVLLIANPTAFAYDGEEHTVNVRMKRKDGVYLREGVDYTVSGNTATAKGTYTLTVEGIGEYSGKTYASWKIGSFYRVTTTINGVSTITTYEERAGVTVNAPNIAGKKFKCWMSDGKIKSYSQSYGFILTKDTELEAEYVGETEEFIPKPVLEIAAERQIYKGKNAFKFVFDRSVNDIYSIDEIGFNYTANKTAGYTTDPTVDLTKTDFDFDAVFADPKKFRTSKPSGIIYNNGTCTFNLTIGNSVNNYYYVRGYVKLVNKETGEETTEYTDLIAVKYNG